MPTPNSSDGVLISDTRAVLVPAPASGKRVITFLSIYNADTAAVRLTLWLHNATSNLFRGIAEVALAVDDTFLMGGDGERLVLQTHQSLQASLAGPTTTRQPDFTVSWEEWT